MPKEIRNEETKTPLSFRITQLFENQKSTALITAKNIEIKIETNFFLRVFTEDELIATRNGIDIESHNKDTNPLFQQYICIYDYLFNMKKIFQVLYNYGYSSLSCENDLKEIFSNETFSISETAMKKYNNFINLAKLYGNKIPNNLKSSQTITIGNYCFSLPSKPPFMTLDNIRYFGHLISSARSGNDASFDELNRQINYLFPTIEYFINKEHLNQLNDDSLLASLEIFNEIFSINKRRKILPVFSKNDEIFNSLKNLQNRFLVTNIQILQVKYPVHTYHLIKPISDFFGFNFYQILWCNQSTNFNNFIIDLESSRNSFTNDIFLIVHPEFLNKNEENNFTDFVKSQISPFPDKNSPKIIVLTAIHNLISLSEHENENYLLSVSPNEVIKYHDATINYLVDTPFRVIYSDQSGDGKTNYIKNLCGKKNYVFIDDEEPDIKSYFNPQEEKIVLFSLNRQTFVDNVIFWDQLYCGYIFKIFLRPTLPPYIPKFDLNEKIIYYIEIPSSYKIHNHNESIGDCLIDFPIPLIEECFIKIDPSKQNCYDSSYIEKNELIVNNQKYTDFYRAAKFMHTFSLEENNKSDFPRFFSFIYSKIFRGETVPYISLRLFSYVESYIRKMIIRYGNNSFDDFHKSLFYTLVLYSSIFIYNLEPCVEGNPNNKKVVSFLCMICDNLLNNKNSNESKVTFYTNRQEKDFIPSLYQNVEIRKHLSNKKLNGIKILFIQNIDKNDQIDMFTRVASQISTDETFLMTVCLCKIADIFLTSTEERKYRIFIDEMTNLIYKKDEITNIFQFFYNLNNE
ncbi:hypothetical protein TRFO_02965 [Tritrichomonas foetus]|uniref:Uncharacterized protein n=1 Tax=Tritrichomonas foetus TaxID=1144522 RepID=A0A1J4KYD1_9EUKA|nr:hypothetical protein TRFO_02965 [Tritrichomonas foetus]|eukprot:OHT14716.1 hypothetical protein TRFO_02965 [Tritrichomonas foetus]